MIALAKETLQAGLQGGINLIAKGIEDSSEVVAKKLAEILEGSDFKKNITDLGDVLGPTLEKLHTINDQQTAAIVANQRKLVKR